MANAKPSILLATPCYGGMANIVFFNSVLRLQRACDARGIALEVQLVGGDALVSRARSRIATDFLRKESPHTHLMFVDADIGFEPEHLFRLLEAGRPLVGGVYPLKRIFWDKAEGAVRRGVKDLQAACLGYVVRFLPSETQSVTLDEGFGQVAYLAGGFMLIERGVLQAVADRFPDLHCKVADMNGQAETAVMFFETMIDPDTREHLSEDYAFCWRWRACGGEVWADFLSRMTHVGHTAYSGGLMDAAGTGA